MNTLESIVAICCFMLIAYLAFRMLIWENKNDTPLYSKIRTIGIMAQAIGLILLILYYLFIKD
ncbi:hypothetical protein GCM10022216_01170 [Sphingobacterium kyonggiense]|uniref:Hypoxia induced protein n=1 Tax=Sphingobacterium kyonggiense TaxID=714075 RepID=A0ABP7Y6Q5_9SPHI